MTRTSASSSAAAVFGAASLILYHFSTVLRLWAFAQFLLFACYGKSTNEDPAKLLLKPQDTTVELNTKVSFFCQAGGNPLPTVVWKRNGKLLTQPRYIVDSNSDGLSTLRIEQLRDRDNQTEFSCTADNGKGPPDTAVARLIVLAPANLPRGFPTIVEDPKLKAVEKGHSAIMSCNVQGDPTPKVVWLRDLMPVDMSNRRYSIATLGSPGSLVIQNSEESDEGKYECVAQNSKGVAHSRSAHLYVKVRRVPPHFSIPPRRKYHIMPGGRVNLTCAAVGHPMPKVFWRKGFDENLDGGPEAAPIGKNVLNLTNVMQSENYTCVAFSKLGHIEASASVEVKSIPDAPSNIKVHNVTSNSVALVWTPSVTSESDEVVKHYIIQYKPKYAEGVDLSEKKSADPKLVIDGLEPYTQYEFTIMGVTDIGRSAPSRPIEATTAEALPSSPPKSVQSRMLAGTATIHVTWEPPEKRNGRILDYAIYYHTRDTDPYEFWKKMNVTDTSAQISSVQMNTMYTIQVAARNSIGFGPMSAKSQVLTTPGIPGQPTNLKATPLSGDKVLLTWEPPLYASSDIVQYAIVYESASAASSPGSSQEMIILAHNNPAPKATVENLKPNSNYSFHVIGISSRGRGVPSAIVTTRTSPAVPSGSPESVVVEPFSSKSLRIMWDPPPKSEQNGLIVNYKISWEPAAGDSDDGGEPGERIVPASNERQRSFVVDGLIPYTEYKVTVAAGTEKGFGPPSKSVTARTLDDVPGPPQNLQVVLDGTDNSSVRLSWEAPLEPNGILVGYNIFAEELENGKVKKSGSRMPSARTSADQTDYTLVDLKPNTEYSFQVNAYNRRGDGKLTKAKTQKMPARKPSEPRNFEIRPMFADSSADVNRLVKAKLLWQAPGNVSGSVFKGYTVRYRPVDSPVDSWEQLTVQHTEVTVSDLKLGRTYEFRVAAENEQGLGKEAVNSLKTPDGVPTAPPMNITCRSNVRSLSVSCNWQPPPLEHRNGDIIGYYAMFVMNDGSNITSPAPIPETSYKVTMNQTYKLFVRAQTRKGTGPWSAAVHVSTANQDELPNPTNVRAQALTNDTALVMWTPVDDQKVIGYRVHYTTEASRNSWESRDVMGRGSNRSRLVGLIPRKMYSLCVSSFGHQVAGDCSGTGLIEFKMEPREVVTNLEADESPRTKGKTKNTVKLTWDYYSPYPVKYQISGHSYKVYKTETGETKSLYMSLPSVIYEPPNNGPKSREFELAVRPYGNYSVDVAVISNGKVYLPQTVNFTTRATGPPLSEEIIIVRPLDSNRVLVKLKPASEEYGPIKKYWVIVTPSEHASKASMETKDLLLRKAGNASGDESWVAAELSPSEMARLKNGEFTIGDDSTYPNHFKNVQLKPGRKYLATLRAFGDPGGDDDGLTYTDSIASKEFGTLLTPDTGQATVPTDPNLWIIGPVVAIVVMAIIIGAICVFLLHRNNFRKKSLPTNRGSISKVMAPASEKTPMLTGDAYGGTVMPTINGSAILPYDTSAPDSGYGGDNIEMRRIIQQQHQPQHYPVPMVSSSSANGFGATHPPIPIIELAAHIDRLKANENFLFSQEYEGIETGQQFTWEHSNMDVNKPKNRYANVIAYDHSRVKLTPLDRVPHSDYINANYIDGYRSKKVYIATQGALPETFADFWRMVWEENSATIVMLTKLEERTRIKCDQYWPTRGTMVYGVVSVTIKETHELAHYTIRSFEIHRQGLSEVREIRQLQFTAWPDHGVPEHPTPFLMFLKRVKSINPPEAGPIVVHCSAGVGRTGAFIVIDVQLERLRYENTVDIYGCVAAIRSQRNYMVQTEDQYVFIYDAVLDAVQSGCTEVPVSKLYTHIQKLMQTQPLDNASAMELEFRQLAAVKLPNARFTAANLPCNKQKNRLVNILPFDSTRVCLMPSPDGSEGSDYINASFVDGYRRRRAYIATQGPLPNTVDDFWRMLWEHNSTIIVMLTKFREMGREICERCHRYKPVSSDTACNSGEFRLVEKCCPYWPSDRGERYGAFVVEPIAEYNMPQYILREFKLTDSRDGQSRTVRHFQYTEWPEQGVPKSSEYFVDFIGQVLKTKEQFGLDGPITVHCSAGVGRTGVFIALSIVLERMRYECVVDIFTTVKLLRTQRPNMVQSEDQYHFCYQAALEYLGSFDYTMQSYE